MDRTLAILKPDLVRKNQIGEVIAKIQKEDFKIVAMRMIKLTRQAAEDFMLFIVESHFTMILLNL
jgi:nucleoside diphosphate kinase (EC 2.7.4.6)